ncbi:MAG: hypothetical protein ACQESB_03230 [Elusimicrobiota bacterium]
MARNIEIASFRFKTDRGKTFFFDLKKNENGRFLRITESRSKPGEKDKYIRNFMTVPESYVDEFIDKLVSAGEYFKSNKEEIKEAE